MSTVGPEKPKRMRSDTRARTTALSRQSAKTVFNHPVLKLWVPPETRQKIDDQVSASTATSHDDLKPFGGGIEKSRQNHIPSESTDASIVLPTTPCVRSLHPALSGQELIDKARTVRCHWCGIPIAGRSPWFLPLKKTSEGVYIVTNYFISDSCALAYLLSSLRPTPAERYERWQLLSALKREMVGETARAIVPAPPKEVLKEYGGTWTEKRYLAALDKGNIVNVVYPPIASLVPQLEEIPRVRAPPPWRQSLADSDLDCSGDESSSDDELSNFFGKEHVA